jgi:hypothetical protein
VRSIAAEQKPGSQRNTECNSLQRKFIKSPRERFYERSDFHRNRYAGLAEVYWLHTMKPWPFKNVIPA